METKEAWAREKSIVKERNLFLIVTLTKEGGNWLQRNNKGNSRALGKRQGTKRAFTYVQKNTLVRKMRQGHVCRNLLFCPHLYAFCANERVTFFFKCSITGVFNLF